MVDPVSLGVMTAVGIAGTAAGGIIGGMGAKEAADAQASAYQYKAGVALLNKQVADQNANWALQSGDIKSSLRGLKGAQDVGQEKVIQAGSGLDVNTGTAARVRQDMTTASAYDQNVIRSDAAKTAYGYEIQSMTDTAESRLDTTAGSQSRTAGDISELTSFINAGASVASKWSQGKTLGMFSNNNFGNSFFGGGSPSGYGAG